MQLCCFFPHQKAELLNDEIKLTYLIFLLWAVKKGIQGPAIHCQVLSVNKLVLSSKYIIH